MNEWILHNSLAKQKIIMHSLSILHPSSSFIYSSLLLIAPHYSSLLLIAPHCSSLLLIAPHLLITAHFATHCRFGPWKPWDHTIIVYTCFVLESRGFMLPRVLFYCSSSLLITPLRSSSLLTAHFATHWQFGPWKPWDHNFDITMFFQSSYHIVLQLFNDFPWAFVLIGWWVWLGVDCDWVLVLVGCWFYLGVGSGWVLIVIGCWFWLGVGSIWVLVLVGCWF